VLRAEEHPLGRRLRGRSRAEVDHGRWSSACCDGAADVAPVARFVAWAEREGRGSAKMLPGVALPRRSRLLPRILIVAQVEAPLLAALGPSVADVRARAILLWC